LAIADVVATAQLPDEVKKDLALYVECVAGEAGGAFTRPAVTLSINLADVEVRLEHLQDVTMQPHLTVWRIPS
jgi:hypothetical protein